MRFPASGGTFVTKDAMADYLEAYAERMNLPVRRGVKVDGLSRHGETFVVTAGGLKFEADNVIVAMANYRVPRVPAFAQGPRSCHRSDPQRGLPESLAVEGGTGARGGRRQLRSRHRDRGF